MALTLSAPVGDKKRTTKPDPKKPSYKFMPVANKPEDVELVQLMLIANGYPASLNGKASPALVKSIQAFQKSKVGYKKPDGIVDPGLETWKAGLPKLTAQIAENERILADRVEITEKGKVKFITRAEYDKRQKEALQGMQRKISSMGVEVDSWIDFCNDAEKTMQGHDTTMMMLTEFVVRWANDKTEPPWTKLLNGRSEISALKSLAKGTNPDWEKILKQEAKTVKAYNAAAKAFQSYIDNRISTASKMIGRLQLVSETSFAVVEAYVTARLIVTRGMSPAKAHALAAASTELVKSSAGEFGEYLAGNEVGWDSVQKIATNTVFAGAAGAIGGKLSDSMATKFAGEFAIKFAGKYAGKYLTKAGIDKFATAFLKSGAGQAFFENLAKETFLLSKTAFEKGKLTKKDFEEALMKAATAGMLKGATGKSLDAFSKAIPDATETVLTKICNSGVMNQVSKDAAKLYGEKEIADMIAKHGDDMIANIAEKLTGKYAEGAALEVLNGAKGTENASQLTKLLQEQLRKDQALRKEIETLMTAEVDARAKKSKLKPVK